MSNPLTNEQQRYVDHILSDVVPRIKLLDEDILSKAVEETKSLDLLDGWSDFVNVQHKVHGWLYAEHLLTAFYLEHPDHKNHQNSSTENIWDLRLGVYATPTPPRDLGLTLDELRKAVGIVNAR